MNATVRAAVHETVNRLTVARLEVQIALRQGLVDGKLGALLVEQLDRAIDALHELVRAARGPGNSE